jgi:hypothetical protein
MSMRAACSCGKLAVVCEGDPVRVSVCHCLACQQRTGSVFGVQARFPADRVSGRDAPWKTYVRVADSGSTVAFRFCPDCGSTVFWELAGLPGFVAVAVGAFADPSFQPPKLSIYEARRHGWVGIDGVEHMD